MSRLRGPGESVGLLEGMRSVNCLLAVGRDAPLRRTGRNCNAGGYTMRLVLTAAVAVVLSSITAFGGGIAWAHHSFVAEFDPAKPKTIEGTVAQIQWENPHARFYVMVKNPSSAGGFERWEVELGSPNTLIRYGWTRRTLSPGVKVTVDGYLARDGHNYLNARTVKLPDGRTVNAGSSYQGGAETNKTPGL